MKKTTIGFGLAIIIAGWIFMVPRYRILSTEFFPNPPKGENITGRRITIDEIESFGLTKAQISEAVGLPDNTNEFLYVTENGQLKRITVPWSGKLCFAEIIGKSPGVGVSLVSGPKRPLKATLYR